ncbi:MAG: hypothetical protein OEL76_04685 [Siculibacillus sp.]|nr:hypothetical protein [Siculibacillus sp.]
MSPIPYRFAVPLLAAALWGASHLPVSATEKGPFNVRSGTSTVVLSYASYDPDTCYFQAIPRLRVATPPAHGSVTIGKSSHAAGKGSCEGKTLRSSVVHYRANPGYRGRDEMVISVESEVFTDGTGIWGDSVRILVDVK